MLTTYNSENFYEFVERYFDAIPIRVSRLSPDSFDELFSSRWARQQKEIVYLWRSERPVPRLRGESTILYVGQTKLSLSDRYANWGARWLNTAANTHKFSHILNAYGAIEILVCSHKDIAASLLEAEGQVLWWYFRNHCEYPPINYTKTKVRNESVQRPSTV
jgi:hypothetical protein